MTIDELIERLEEYRDELGGQCAVRLMTAWPASNPQRCHATCLCGSSPVPLRDSMRIPSILGFVPT